MLRAEAATVIDACFQPGFGLRATDKGAFGPQIWMRDAMLASVAAPPASLQQTLETMLGYVRETDGVVPYRVESNHHVRSYALGWLKRFGVDLVSRRKPEPIYRDSPLAVEAIDTVPAMIIAFSQVYNHLLLDDAGAAGGFLNAHYPTLVRALDADERYVDPRDGLVISPELGDWADDVRRKGKLSLLNILFERAHNSMSALSNEQGDLVRAKTYLRRSRAMRRSIMRTFWNPRGFFQAGQHDTRIDSPANVLAGLFWPQSRAAARGVLTTAAQTAAGSGFLRIFDRGYPATMLRTQFMLAGFSDFTNRHVYPWIAQVSILARLRRARALQRRGNLFAAQTTRLVEGAWADFLAISEVHQRNGSFYEILHHRTLEPADFRIWGVIPISRSCEGFLCSAATWMAVVREFETHFGLDLSH